MPAAVFAQSLTPAQHAQLHAVREGAVHPAPTQQAVRWYLGDVPVGWLQRIHVHAVQQVLPGVRVTDQCMRWDAQHLTPAQRSHQLAQAAQALRAQGLITGWRNECYSYWGEITHDPDPAQPEWFRMERAAFRFFGLRSHAVHINGFTPEGRMWCGRRALSKATDPGRLDNVAAGGLAADEHMLDCAVRELYEEAGLHADVARQVQRAGRITTARMEPQGWHDETIVVYNLRIPAGVTPRNTDGEVSEFVCLTPEQVLTRMAAREFSDDAACVIAQGVLA